MSNWKHGERPIYPMYGYTHGTRMTIWHCGQFGTVDNLAPPMLADNLAPQCKSGQFGIRTIWHRIIIIMNRNAFKNSICSGIQFHIRI